MKLVRELIVFQPSDSKSMFEFFGNKIKYRKERVNRIIIDYQDGTYSCGSGFFIEGTNKFLTCFHVVFGSELSKLRANQDFINIQSSSEHEKLLNFLNARLNKITIHIPDGTKVGASLKDFSEKYDIAILESNIKFTPKGFKIDFDSTLSYYDEVFFCGYQYAVNYNPKQYPFTVNKGIVSTFLEITIGGENYKHIQINSINLGGNSGAPLFRRGEKRVIGIINGNMNWGNDSVMIKNLQNNQVMPKSFRIPLSIAYATPLKLLKEKTNLLNF